MTIASAEKIDKIITKSVSRFARNTEELLNVIRLLKNTGVSVYFEEQNINTEKLNAEIILTFPGMAAQKESETISGNVRWSYKKRMESGEYNCTKTPFGYDLIDGELKVNEKEADIIKDVLSLYLNGHGIHSIAEFLNGRKIKKRYSDKKWNNENIRILINRLKLIFRYVIMFSSETYDIYCRSAKISSVRRCNIFGSSLYSDWQFRTYYSLFY